MVALSDGRFWDWLTYIYLQFSALERAPMHIRLIDCLRRLWSSILGCPVSCRYISHRPPSTLKMGYLIMDYVEEWRTLADTWEELRGDKDRRANLFRDLSRIMLSLGRVPLPRIGSFTINNKGVVSLTNRPLTLRIQTLENEGIPTNIGRDRTYLSAWPYYVELLACHDSRLLHQPNSIYHERDCRDQMAVLTIMRSILPSFVDQTRQHGPFLFTLTDLQPSNIFVDKDWNVKCLIDLEWACSLPIEMESPPCWLTSRGVD